MVHCFAPDCNHHSESHTCSFFGFPSKEKKLKEYRRWIHLLRREDREPGKHSRVCSCHFREGKKSNGPEIFKRNQDKLFPAEEAKPKKKKIESQQTLQEMIEAARKKEELEQGTSGSVERLESTRKEVILEAELEQAKREMIDQREKNYYVQKHYTVSKMSEEVLKMETGLPTKEVFQIVVNYAARFKQSINYFAG